MRIMPRAKECQSGSSTHRLRSISDSSLLSEGPRPGTALSLTSTPPSSTLMTVGDVTNAQGNRGLSMRIISLASPDPTLKNREKGSGTVSTRDLSHWNVLTHVDCDIMFVGFLV